VPNYPFQSQQGKEREPMTTDMNPVPVPAPASGPSPERQAQRAALTEQVRAKFQHELNIAYGQHPKQILDIYHPRRSGLAPVLVFLHGGGFRNGAPGPQGYVGAALLEHGGMFVPMGYRLIPDAPYPDSCDDVELGLQWLMEHVEEHGGDPSHIYLSGTSAGASLTAAVALRHWVAQPALPADLIQGIVLFSGRYDRTASDQQVDDASSPRYVPQLTKAVERTPAHAIVVNTTDESAFPDVPGNALALVNAITAAGGPVERFIQPDADHFSSSRSLAGGDGAIWDAVCRMMRLD
jgi:acetyl esterase/lipase